MTHPKLKRMFCVLVALAAATVGFGHAPTPQQALDYAKSVVLVRRVVKDGQVYSYVKAVWRADPNEGAPAVGSEYGEPIPAGRMHHADRDAILFRFGEDPPEGLPNGWGIQVAENGMVYPFQMNVDQVRVAVEETKPKT